MAQDRERDEAIPPQPVASAQEGSAEEKRHRVANALLRLVAIGEKKLELDTARQRVVKDLSDEEQGELAKLLGRIEGTEDRVDVFITETMQLLENPGIRNYSADASAQEDSLWRLFEAARDTALPPDIERHPDML